MRLGRFYHQHGDTARKTLTRRALNVEATNSPTPPHIVHEEMAQQSDMAERGRRLRYAKELKERLTMKGAA